MKIINLSKSAALNDAVELVNGELVDTVRNKSYITHQIKETRFNRFNDITITAEILLRNDDGISVKRVAYCIIDGVLFQSLPHSALCDEAA